MRSAKHDAVARTYTHVPDPDGDGPADQRGPGMDPRQRLITPMAGAAPWQQFTPDQMSVRETAAGGRWQTDSAAGATANMNQIKQDPSGVTDVSRMEADQATESYVDLGGHGAMDYAVRRP